MPYLNYLFCDKCGPPANLDVDYVATINSYVVDGRSPAVIDDRTLVWDYLIYGCRLCGTKERYTFRDVELKVRKYLASKSQEYRVYVDELSGAQESEEARRSGFFFSNVDEITAKRLKDMYEK